LGYINPFSLPKWCPW